MGKEMQLMAHKSAERGVMSQKLKKLLGNPFFMRNGNGHSRYYSDGGGMLFQMIG